MAETNEPEYLVVSDAEVSKTVSLSEDVSVDLGAGNKLVGIERRNPEAVVPLDALREATGGIDADTLDFLRNYARIDSEG